MANETPSWPPPPESYGGAPTGFSAGTPPRHGCLTAWLVLMIVGNVFAIVIYSLTYHLIHKMLPAFTPAIVAGFILACLVGIASAVALFQGRRWGFYGMVGITAVSFALNLMAGLGIGRAVTGLVGVAVLYAVLNLGGPNKAWRFLK